MEDEREYLRRRAEQELKAAQEAEHPEAARSHSIVAGQYLDRAKSEARAADDGEPISEDADPDQA